MYSENVNCGDNFSYSGLICICNVDEIATSAAVVIYQIVSCLIFTINVWPRTSSCLTRSLDASLNLLKRNYYSL